MGQKSDTSTRSEFSRQGMEPSGSNRRLSGGFYPDVDNKSGRLFVAPRRHSLSGSTEDHTYFTRTREFESFLGTWWTNSNRNAGLALASADSHFGMALTWSPPFYAFCSSAFEDLYSRFKTNTVMMTRDGGVQRFFFLLCLLLSAGETLLRPDALDVRLNTFGLGAWSLVVLSAHKVRSSFFLEVLMVCATAFAYVQLFAGWTPGSAQHVQRQFLFGMRAQLVHTCLIISGRSTASSLVFVAAHCACIALAGVLQLGIALDPAVVLSIAVGSSATGMFGYWIDLRLRRQFVKAASMFETEMVLKNDLMHVNSPSSRTRNGEVLAPSRMETALDALRFIMHDFQVHGYSPTVTDALSVVISSLARSSHKDWAPFLPTNTTPPRSPASSTLGRDTSGRDLSAGVTSYVQDILGEVEDEPPQWGTFDSSGTVTPTPRVSSRLLARMSSATEASSSSSTGGGMAPPPATESMIGSILQGGVQHVVEQMQRWDFGEDDSGIWSRLNDADVRFRQSPLTLVTMCALRHLNLLRVMGLDKTTACRYFMAVEARYKPAAEVPYHNALHAADVVQCVFSMFANDPDMQLNLPPYAVFALVMGAAIHDVAHPGLNNNFLQLSCHELALRYNDRSILENFHVSTALSIMIEDRECDLFAPLRAPDSRAAFRSLHNLLVDIVLGTDMTKHSEQLTRIEHSGILGHWRMGVGHGAPTPVSAASAAPMADAHLTSDEVSLVSSVLLHAADVSNVARKWMVYKPWIDCLFEEFFAQGDLERVKKLEVTPFCDRLNANPFEIQANFIRIFVLPLYKVVGVLAPVSGEQAIDNMLANVSILNDMSHHPESAAPAQVRAGALTAKDTEGSLERQQ